MGIETSKSESDADEASPIDAELEEAEEEPDEGEAQTAQIAADEDFVGLAAGLPLDSSETEILRRHHRTRLIVLAGDSKSGKTTFLASIFMRFQKGPFSDYLFAGSDTLMGFEARCWPSRAASLGLKATTIKTPAGKENFYHLRVRMEGEDIIAHDLLFSDVSGEIYQRAVSSSAACAEIGEVQQADHFVLLLDGAKLRSYDERPLVFSNARQLLRRLLDSKVLSMETSVQVVFTKNDMLKANADELVEREIVSAEDCCPVNETDDYIQMIQANMEQEFEVLLSHRRYFRVTSRSDLDESYELADGIAPILPLWVEELPERRPTRELPAALSPRTEPDKFLLRELGQLVT